MDRPSGNDASQPQSPSSTVTNPPSLSLGAGQQASILQVGGQSFLILTAGQPASPLQGLGLNLVPVGAPNASLLPQAPFLQAGGVPPALRQIGEAEPCNQTKRVPPSVVQKRGLTLKLGAGAQPQTVQASKLRSKPSQSFNPHAAAVQVGGLQVVQGGHTGPPQSETLQIHANSEPGVDSVKSVLTKTGGAILPFTQVGRVQPNIIQVGGPLTSSSQVGSTVPLDMRNAKTIPIPTGKIEIQSTTEKAFLPAIVHPSEAMPPLTLTIGAEPNIQFGGLQSFQVACDVPKHTEFSHFRAQNKTGPGLEDAEIMPLTIQASGRYAEPCDPIGFANPIVQSSQFRTFMGHTGGFQSLAPQENAKTSALAKKHKQSMTKRGSKCQQDTPPTYVDVACSAYTLVKMKHVSTNTTKKNKSIGTQVKFSMKNKSQGVQFPEISHGEAEALTCQESFTQSEETSWPGPESDESHPHKVVIVRHPEPEDVSLCLSEASRGDSDLAWNVEGLTKQIHRSYDNEKLHFDDVAIYFTEEEWACLNGKEKNFYKKVMMDNYWNFVALGKISVTPPVISRIERGEEPYVRSLHRQFPDSRYDPSSQNIYRERYNIQHFYERLKMITSPIKLDVSGLAVTRIISEPSSCEPSQAAQEEDRIRDPGEQCPFKPFLKEKPVINEKPFRCFKCERTFKRFGSLISHYRAHQSEKDLTCPECGKKFTKIKGLLLHNMRHTGERPFVCSGCGKTFTSQVCLNNHLKLNLKKKQYKCLECGKRFGVKQSLLKHEKVHQMGNHNVCQICGKGFLQMAGLQLHQKVHSSPYICSHCGRCFDHKEDCEKHMVDHSQMQLFDCTECGNAYIYESQLMEHQKLHQTDHIDSAYPDLVIKVEEED